MCRGAGGPRCMWPGVLVAIGAVVLMLSLVVWMVTAPPEWVKVGYSLLTLPASLVACWGGHRMAWIAVTAGTLFPLLSQVGGFIAELLPFPVIHSAIDELLAGRSFFPVVLLAAGWDEVHRPVGALSQRPSDEAEVEDHTGAFDLRATFDAILSSIRQLMPYDIAEITLWDEEQGCCVTQGWGGDPAYAQEVGGVYGPDEGYTGWIVRHRCPLFIPDVQARRDVRPRVDAPKYPFQSYVGIPLQVRGTFVGTLELASYESDVYSERDLEVLQAVAGQAAVAIESAHLYVETRRRAEQQAGLARIAGLAGSTLDLDELLDGVMGETLRLLEAEKGVLLLYDEEQDALVARYLASAGADRETVKMFKIPTSAEGFEQSVFARGGSYFCNDLDHDPNIIPAYRPHTDALGIRNFAGVALRLKDRSIGELYLGDRRSGFGCEEVRVLKTVAGYVASAIENARLYDAMRRRASELASLTQISATVSESLELEHVLRAIASAVLEVVGCQRSAIFVLDEAQHVLRLAMTQGLSEEYAAQSQVLTLKRGGRAHAVVTGQPLIVSDVQADASLLAFAPMSIREGFRAFADLPLRRADRVIGMLSAMFVEPHRFSEMEIELLTAFADQAAIAIDNARLYAQTDEELRRGAEALSSLQRVSREISATLDLGHILHLVLEEASRLGEATRGAILLREAASGDLRLEVCAGYPEAEEAHIRSVLRVPETHPLVAEVLRTHESLLIPDVDAALDELGRARGSDASIGTETRSMLLVPIFYEESLAGLILMESTEKEVFDQGVLEFTEGLSAQTATAFGNAQRYREQLRRGELLRRRADQLAMVLEVSRALRSDRPLEEILEEVAYAIQESVGFNLVLLGVVEGYPPYQRRVAAAGLPIAEFERMKEVLQPWSVVADVMSEEFRISQSYYIPAERQSHWRDRLDVYEEKAEDVVREPGLWHPHDMLLVPLIGPGGDTQGLLSVDQPRNGRVPDLVTVEALEIFAGQAALAIENARQVEVLQRRAETMALFNEINRSATAKLDLNEVLDLVVEMAPQLLSCDRSSIFLLDAKTGRYTPRAAYGFALEQIGALTFAVGEGLAGAVAESRMPMAVDDVRHDPRFIPGSGEVEIGSTVLAPLTVGDQVVGIICVDREEPYRFSPAEVATLSALADQVAVAVENARLFDEVRRFSQELERRVEERTQALAEAMDELTREHKRVETLYRITSQLAASLDLDRVLNRALELVVEAGEAERATILMLEPETGRLINRASLGADVKLPLGGVPTRFSRGEGLAGWVVEHREAVIVPDIREDPHWVEPLNKVREYRSALAVPLLVGDEVLGVLLLFHAEPGNFDEDHLLLVETAVIQVANAIKNAELYSLIRDQAERLGTMLKAQQVEAAKSQAILEGVADGVIVADAQGKIILFNAAAERILELSREQALGRPTNEMLGLYGSQARDWMETVNRWAEQSETYATEEYLVAQLEIGDRIVSVHLAPALMGDEFLGTVSVFRDVTAEVEAERAKTEFVSTVSHELRTPMTSIKGYVDLLLLGAAGMMTESQQHFLSIVKNNTDRLTMLVGDLLDISRIESGRVALAPRAVRVENAVNQVIVAMETRAADKGLILRSDVPPELPEALADPDRVVQILTNLVANACYYTPTGGEVVLSASAQKDGMHISVRDTGIGIAKEDQEKVFDRFFRADDPVVQDAPGTGLGLFIVRSLVEMQGGRVWVDSELGEGSTFTFVLPIAEATRTAKARGEHTRATTKVLVIEDDLDIARLIQLHLAGDGREVLIAQRGDEAIELAQRECPDLITLDILLPGVDGFTVLEELKSNPATQGIPVVVVSVLPDRDEYLRLGAVDYVTKPIDERRLLRTVRQVLVRRGTVLVVDDDKDNLSLMRELLRTNGFGVRTTSRGRRALRVAREVRPSLILLDLKIRDLDGQVVLKRLKADPATRDIPVIVMTGSMTVDDTKRRKVLALGAARFMSKPFSVQDLIEEIEMVLWEDGRPEGGDGC
jgi:PAS domain S-box-containing protein